MYKLWNSVSRWVSVCANRYYTLHEEQCKRSGVTAEDLAQEGYIAFVNAVETYKHDSGHKFITHLRYPLLNAFSTLTGTRTVRGRKEPLNNSDSLDRPTIDESEPCTLGDMIEDEAAAAPFVAVEDDVYNVQLHNALDTVMAESLTEREKEIIVSRFYKNMTLTEVGAVYGFSCDYARQQEQKALRRLRHPRASRQLKQFSEHIISRSYRHGGLSEYRHTWTSSTEWAAIKLLEGYPPIKTE